MSKNKDKPEIRTLSWGCGAEIHHLERGAVRGAYSVVGAGSQADGGNPMIELCLSYTPENTECEPDFWSITWVQFVDHIYDELQSYLPRTHFEDRSGKFSEEVGGAGPV
jgi:hypothetical protein